jgi:hypothetical protein
MKSPYPFARVLNLALTAISIVFFAACATPNSPSTTSSIATTISLRLIGEQTVEHRAQIGKTMFGGISGIDYDEKRNLFYLLSDDRSDNDPARFYTAKLSITASEFSKPEFIAVTFLTKPDGANFGNKNDDVKHVPDPEAIRYLAASDTLLWANEGDKKLMLSPYLREMKLDGTFIRELPTLPMFAMKAGDAGSRDNATFEGLTLARDNKRVWVAMEGPIFEDGTAPTVASGGAPLRITQYDLANGQVLRQIAYQPDAIPHRPMPPNAYADNGVPEILMLDDHRMLVLERSFSVGVGNSLRVYMIDTRDGSDTKDVAALKPDNHTVVKKSLVINFDSLNLQRLDNTEAMSFGPRLANGNRTLIFASDDNFNRRQINQLLAFEVLEK